MKERTINNWCDREPITISIAAKGTLMDYGPLLYITQSAGGMSFQHTITPNQARLMAQGLIDLAAEVEAVASMEVTP